jgi:hypothetical protein
MSKPRLINPELALEMKQAGKNNREIAEYFHVSRPAVVQCLQRLLPSEAEKILDESGLTVPMKKFCVAQASGQTRTQSVLAGYETTDKSSISTIACDLMKDERIVDCISRLMLANGLDRNYKIRRLKQHVDSQDGMLSMRALDTAFRLTDDFPANKSLNLHGDVTPALNAISELARRILARQPIECEVIDVSVDGDEGP